MNTISLPATWARRVPRVGEVQHMGEAGTLWAPSGASLTASFH